MALVRKALGCALAFFVALALYHSVAIAADRRLLTIGIIAPLTGPLASLGMEIRAGAMLAAEAGNGECRTVLKFEDDQIDPKKTLSGFMSLISGGIDGAVCFGSTSCHSIGGLAERKPVPLMAVASDRSVTRDRQYVFRLEISPAAEARTLLDYIQRKNLNRIVSIVAEHDGTLAGHAALSELQEFSRSEILNLRVLPGAVDFRSEITKLMRLNPGSIVLIHYGHSAGQLARQLREQGYQGPLLGMNFIDSKETLESARGALEGMVFTNIAEPPREFVQKYRARFSKDPDYGAAHGYDAVSLLSRALCPAGDNAPGVAWLRQLRSYDGALGKYGASGKNEFDIPVALHTVRHGQFAALEPMN